MGIERPFLSTVGDLFPPLGVVNMVENFDRVGRNEAGEWQQQSPFAVVNPDAVISVLDGENLRERHRWTLKDDVKILGFSCFAILENEPELSLVALRNQLDPSVDTVGLRAGFRLRKGP